MTKVLSGKELDHASIDAAIARSPFNAHEKSHVAVGRSVMALMYKDGYRAALTHAEYRALEDENGRLKDKLADYEDLCTERNTEIQHLREELASIKARVGDDADRWRYLVDRVFYLDGRFRASAVELASIDLRGVPGQSGGDLLTACVDTARKEPK